MSRFPKAFATLAECADIEIVVAVIVDDTIGKMILDLMLW
jgi:hypothetical protein